MNILAKDEKLRFNWHLKFFCCNGLVGDGREMNANSAWKSRIASKPGLRLGKNISYKSNSFSSLAQWLLFMCQDPLYSQTVCPVFIEEFCELIQVLCRHKG